MAVLASAVEVQKTVKPTDDDFVLRSLRNQIIVLSITAFLLGLTIGIIIGIIIGMWVSR